jgi:endonuclease/exonuclease/phosphatase family metal-dependent hydrolase
VLRLLSCTSVGGLAGCAGDDGGGGTPTATPSEGTPTETPADSTSAETPADSTPAETPTATPTRTATPTDTPTQTPPWDAGLLRAMSFNVRYDNPDDDPPWSERRDRVVDAVAGVAPDVVGLQETLPHQFEYVREELDAYGWYGVGRQSDGGGEHAPIGWRSDRFEALDRDTLWLSETPDEPGSIGWNANLPRIASWVDLAERATGLRVRAYCTHFSHVSREARVNSSALLRDRIEDWLRDGRMVVVLGDFNFTPDSEPYVELTRSGLVDARRVADSVEGPEGTFQGFGGDPGERIDYVFLPTGVGVERFRTLPPAEPLRSDHLPVVADIDRDAVEAAFG